MPANGSSSKSPARCRTRACAREPAMSCRASRQSKCVDFESAANASAGPPLKRPPHKLVRFSLTRITTQVDSALGGNLGRQTEQVNEALRQGLIERIAVVVSCQVIAEEARIGHASADVGAVIIHH